MKITHLWLTFFTCQFGFLTLRLGAADASSAAKLLMRKIFEEEGYNPAIRPVRNHSQAVNVEVDLAIQQIISVDVKREQITVLYWQRLHWYDEYLVWDPKDYGNLTHITIMPKHIWLPDIVVYNNVINRLTEKDGIIPVAISNDGFVKWDIPIIYVTTCSIHIRHFPYDAQVCSLKFGSWINTAAEITIKNLRGQLDTQYFTINGEWILLKTPSFNTYVEYTNNKSYTDVFYELHLLRRALFYEKNLVIPTAMISVLASLTFLLPPESGEKIGLAITVFLALCVNLLLVSEMMPATSLETPILGQYYLMAISMVAVSLLMTVIVLNFHNPHPNALPPPKWLKHVFSNWLAPLVFLSRVKKDQSAVKPCNGKTKKNGSTKDESKTSADYIVVDNCENGNGGIDTSGVSGTALGALDAKLTDLMDRLTGEGEDEDAKTVQEWQYITRVIDRLFAVIFFAVTVFLTFYLIGKAKTVKVN